MTTAQPATSSSGDPFSRSISLAVLDSMTEGVSVSGDNGIIVYTNPAEDRLFGYEAGELIGQHVSVQSSWPPEVIDELRRTGSWRGEWLNRRKDGTPFRTSARITSIVQNGSPYFVRVQENITDREHDDEKRERTLSTLTDILETVSESFIAVDREWRVTYANRRVLTRTGLALDALIGRNLWEAFPEAAGTEFRPQYERVMEERVPVRFEMDYFGQWLDVNVHPTSEGLAAHVLDITARKRAEESLRHAAVAAELARQQLQVTLESLVQPILMIDSSGAIVDANPAAAELHRFETREELLSNVERYGSLFEARNTDGTPLSLHEWPAVRALAGETVRGQELKVTRRDADVSWIGSYDAIPIRDEDGRVVRVVISIHDLTARKQYEGALRDSEERLRVLLNALPQLVWTCTTDGAVDFVNQRWVEYTGLTETEALGRGWRKALFPDDAEHASQLEDAMREGKPFELRYRVRRHCDGAWRWHLIRGHPLADSTGRLVKWVGTNTDIEDQVRSEASARDAADRLSLALAASRMGDWSWDAATDITTLSDRGSEIFGHRSMTWTAMQQLLHPDDREFAAEEVRRAIETRGNYDIEYRVRRPSGGWKWVSAKGLGTYAADGTVLGMIGVVQDISDRKAGEEALRQNEETLRLTQEGAGVGSWLIDLTDPANHYWSATAYSVAGFESGWTPNYSEWLSRVHPDDREQVDSILKSAVAGESDTFTATYRIEGHDSVERWNEARGRVRRDRGGRITGLTGIVLDITERRRAEDAVRETEQRFRTLANEAPVLTWLSGETTARYWFNRHWLELTGRTLEQEQGEGWVENVHPDDRDRVVSAWHEAFAARREFGIEYRLRRHDGNWRWIYGRGIPMQADGVFRGFIGSCVDITERIATEHSLRAVNEELRRANTDLEQFAFAAAHDLQEPLRMMTSYTQLLARRIQGGLDERGREYVTFVVDAARHMSALLNDLLAYTETGQSGEAHPEEVSLEQILDQALVNMRSAIAESHAAILRDPLPVVAGRSSQFVQLFQNLIANAIKYRKPGVTPEIRVSAKREGNEWVFRIADNGIGIESQYHRQIFGVFRRLHGKQIPGTGIGLAICQRVVERAGGRIWVESEPVEGSTFCFTLPVPQRP